MSPTLVLRDGRPLLSVGAAGGPTIISQTVLAILGVVDFGLSPAEALAQPRFHHQWKPDELRVEEAVPADVRQELARRGHRIKAQRTLGAAQAVGWDAQRGIFQAAADPRGEGVGGTW
jgi:gamma-glutamyltranspeptidase/glutathione hydrolase